MRFCWVLTSKGNPLVVEDIKINSTWMDNASFPKRLYQFTRAPDIPCDPTVVSAFLTLAITAGENVKHCGHYGKEYGRSTKIRKKMAVWSRNSSSGCAPKRIQSRDSNGYLYTHVHSSIIDSSQKWKQSKGLPTEAWINKLWGRHVMKCYSVLEKEGHSHIRCAVQGGKSLTWSSGSQYSSFSRKPRLRSQEYLKHLLHEKKDLMAWDPAVHHTHSIFHTSIIYAHQGRILSSYLQPYYLSYRA